MIISVSSFVALCCQIKKNHVYCKVFIVIGYYDYFFIF